MPTCLSQRIVGGVSRAICRAEGTGEKQLRQTRVPSTAFSLHQRIRIDLRGRAEDTGVGLSYGHGSDEWTCMTQCDFGIQRRGTQRLTLGGRS